MEALIGFILFSMMLMIYLPSYHNELQRIEGKKEETVKWQLFYDLTKTKNSQSESENFITRRIEAFQLMNGMNVDFNCESLRCWIRFEDGDYDEVAVVDIQ